LCSEVVQEEDKHVTDKETFILNFQVFTVLNIKVTIFFTLASLSLSGRHNNV